MEWKDRRTDGGDNNIPFAFLKKLGDKNLMLISFAKLDPTKVKGFQLCFSLARTQPYCAS